MKEAFTLQFPIICTLINIVSSQLRQCFYFSASKNRTNKRKQCEITRKFQNQNELVYIVLEALELPSISLNLNYVSMRRQIFLPANSWGRNKNLIDQMRMKWKLKIHLHLDLQPQNRFEAFIS